MAEPGQPTRSGGGFKGALKRPIGPLPTWAWIAIIALIIVGWAYMRSRKSKKAGVSSPSGSGQVPQFVNQTYTTVQPPEPPQPPPGEDHDRDRDHKRRRHRRRHPTHDVDSLPKNVQPLGPQQEAFEHQEPPGRGKLDYVTQRTG